MDNDGHSGRQRDRPAVKKRPLLEWLCWLLDCWGADLLMVVGAGCVSAGAGLIYLPAGIIAAGALLIVGGVLWARGGGSS